MGLIEGEQAGFSLIEVMMALTIFGTFVAAYMGTEGALIKDSAMLEKELILQRLVRSEMDKILLSPPKLNPSLTLIPKVVSLQDQGFPNYEMVVEWRELKIPNPTAIFGKEKKDADGGDDSGDDGDMDSRADSDAQGLENQITALLKNNLEKIIWQVRVTVREKDTDFPMVLSSFVTNPDAKISMGSR